MLSQPKKKEICSLHMVTYRRHFERLERSSSTQSTRLMHGEKISDNFPILAHAKRARKEPENSTKVYIIVIKQNPTTR